MGNIYKSRLAALGKRQVDLLAEVRKRGYKNLQPPQISNYLSGMYTGPQAQAVLKIIGDILDEWEKETA